MNDKPLLRDERPLAIVTGASRGIGRAVALELARTHHIVATYRTRESEAAGLRDQCGAEIFRLDLASRDDREALISFCRQKWGRLDLLVNNAGMAPRSRVDLLEAAEESFDEILAANLKGPYFLTQSAARWMQKQQAGRIIFITSISADTSSPNRGEYCLSKAALSMAVKLFADRLAASGIPVFEIRPGIIRTDMIAPVAAQYETKIAAGLLPQGRMGEPRDVALAVRAIADGLLDYSTGQVIHVDGGFSLRRL